MSRKKFFCQYWTVEAALYNPLENPEKVLKSYSLPFSAYYDAEAVVMWVCQNYQQRHHS